MECAPASSFASNPPLSPIPRVCAFQSYVRRWDDDFSEIEEYSLSNSLAAREPNGTRARNEASNSSVGSSNSSIGIHTLQVDGGVNGGTGSGSDGDEQPGTTHGKGGTNDLPPSNISKNSSVIGALFGVPRVPSSSSANGEPTMQGSAVAQPASTRWGGGGTVDGAPTATAQTAADASGVANENSSPEEEATAAAEGSGAGAQADMVSESALATLGRGLAMAAVEQQQQTSSPQRPLYGYRVGRGSAATGASALLNGATREQPTAAADPWLGGLHTPSFGGPMHHGHPPGSFSHFVATFGVGVFVLWKLVMLQKRLLFVAPGSGGAGSAGALSYRV